MHSTDMDTTIDEFLDHHGVKGMQWGVRKAASSARIAGRGAAVGAKATGRGIKKTARFAVDHPKLSATTIAAGATLAGIVLSRTGAKPADTYIPRWSASGVNKNGTPFHFSANSGETFDMMAKIFAERGVV